MVQTNRRTATPYSGWVLELAIELDRACPGLLAATFRFASQRRQALFLVLALAEILGINEVADHLRSAEGMTEFTGTAPTAVLGEAVLRLRRPRDLVRTVLAGPPVGLLGTLARLGDDPIGEPRTYYELARLFLSRDPADRRRAKVLGQISGPLVGAQIAVVSQLEPVLLHPALVATITATEQVAQLHRALAYVRAHCSRATDEAIRASLGCIKPGGHWADLIRYWAARFDRLPCSLDTHGDPTLVVLDSGEALTDAGRRHKNCLADKIHEVLIGIYLFVEHRPETPGEPGLIAELRRTTQGYLLEGIYARENRRVRADRACIVRGKLAACGVAILDHGPGDWKALDATARALGIVDFDEPDLAGGWGDEVVEVAAGLRQVLDEAA